MQMKKISDCAKILKTYESWIPEVYHKAGFINKLPEKTDPEIPDEASANPDRPYAHVVFFEG